MKLYLNVFLFCIVYFLRIIAESECTSFPYKMRIQCYSPRTIKGCEKTGHKGNDTFFYLFTRKNPDKAEFLHNCGRKLPKNTNFDPKNPTEILIHGYTDILCVDLKLMKLKDAIFQRGNYNVIYIDWNSQNFGTVEAVAKDQKITAKEIAELMTNIQAQTGVGLETFHLVGHSMGAHLAGVVGNYVRVERITGLDPGGPLFYGLPSDELLDRNDAQYVDVIHTGGGRFWFNLGYLYPLGDDDFYVNGGSHQFNCLPMSLKNIADGDKAFGIFNLLFPKFCHHSLALDYYRLSLNPGSCQFVGKQCKTYRDALSENCDSTCNKDVSNCAVMGMDWIKFHGKKRKESRIFLVKTSHTTPFCISDNSTSLFQTSSH